MQSRVVFIILVGLFACNASLAQSNDQRTDFQTWTDITFTYHKSPKFSFGGDAGIRGLVSNRNWNQLYVRPTVHYKFSQLFTVSGGIGSFNTFNQDYNNTYEVRVFQDFQFAWPSFGWIDFSHRFRFEERFFFYPTLNNDFSARGRYLIDLKTRHFKLIGKVKGYYVSAMWEAFAPLGESPTELFINNERWYAVMGYRASEKWQFELHYIWQESRLVADDGFESQQGILRLRAFHTIRLAE